MTAFRALQHELDELIDLVEEAVERDASELPPHLLKRIEGVLAAVYGERPPWLDEVSGPVSLQDHLLIAEGQLRREFYADRDIDVRESL